MWTYTNTDELCHYGVIGMKWGVRTARATGKVAKATGKAIGKSAKRIAKRDVSNMKKANQKASNDLAKVKAKANKIKAKGKGLGHTMDANSRIVQGYANAGPKHAKAFTKTFAGRVLLPGASLPGVIPGKTAVKLLIKSRPGL